MIGSSMTLEQTLATDTCGREMRRVTRRLTDGRDRARTALSRVIAEDQRRRLLSLISAYGAAIELIPLLAQQFQQQRSV
jgi:hypothetical protein